MAKNSIQLFLRKSTRNVEMKVKEYLADLPVIRSFYDLNVEDKLPLALILFEESGREECSEALSLDDRNSDVMCKLITLLENENIDNSFDFNFALKQSFVRYFDSRIEEIIDDYLAAKDSSIMEEHGLKRHYHKDNGESYWSK